MGRARVDRARARSSCRGPCATGLGRAGGCRRIRAAPSRRARTCARAGRAQLATRNSCARRIRQRCARCGARHARAVWTHGERQRCIGQSRSRGLATDLPRTIAARAARLRAGLAAHAAAADLASRRVAVGRLGASHGARRVAGVQAQARCLHMAFHQAHGGAADFARNGVAIRGLCTGLRAFGGWKAVRPIVDGAADIPGLALAVGGAQLHRTGGGGADLVRLSDVGEHAGLPCRRVTTGVGCAFDGALRRGDARLARRAVVAAHLPIRHVAVLVRAAIAIAARLTNSLRGRCCGGRACTAAVVPGGACPATTEGKERQQRDLRAQRFPHGQSQWRTRDTSSKHTVAPPVLA